MYFEPLDRRSVSSALKQLSLGPTDQLGLTSNLSDTCNEVAQNTLTNEREDDKTPE